MRVFHADAFGIPLPPDHRFPLQKYGLLRERVAVLYGDAITLSEAPRASVDALHGAHDSDYVARVLKGQLSRLEQRAIGFPWSLELVERSLRSAGATISAGKAALADGCAITLSGGTHHADADRGAGFCVFNDVAVATRVLQAQPGNWPKRVLVVDCDVHQGDGTARIFDGDDSVFTVSLHGAGNFPFRKARSDLDVEFPDGADDPTYLAALEATLSTIDERFSPGAVFYLAGADPYRGDTLGRLALSINGLAARDRRVLEWCRDRHLPVTICMAGGYAKPINDTVSIHANTVGVALEIFPQASTVEKPA